jgi:selenocysteine lyase/cysteine desulfurase
LRDDLGAARFDLFGTANFLAFAPWTASLRYLLDLSIQRVAKHDQGLVDRLLEGLDPERWRVLSPRGGPERSTLVLLSRRDPGRNPDAHGLLREAGVDVALRGGNLRVSPHVHNTAADVDRLLEVLAGFAA